MVGVWDVIMRKIASLICLINIRHIEAWGFNVCLPPVIKLHVVNKTRKIEKQIEEQWKPGP